MINQLLGAGRFPRGSLCALMGLIVVASYYRYAWRNLRSGSGSLDMPRGLEYPTRQPWTASHYLQMGTILSVVFFMVSWVVDAGSDVLYWVIYALIAFCDALVFAMFGWGFVALANLWKELVPQLRRASLGRLLLSAPVAVLWLAMGLGGFVLLGMLLEELGQLSGILGRSILKHLAWPLIAFVFWRLWMNRGHAALVLRLVLMISFSAIMLGAGAFTLWWTASQTALRLVVLLASLGSLNVFFYSRFVRDSALKYNLGAIPIVKPGSIYRI